jgi:hypothetical protein
MSFLNDSDLADRKHNHNTSSSIRGARSPSRYRAINARRGAPSPLNRSSTHSLAPNTTSFMSPGVTTSRSAYDAETPPSVSISRQRRRKLLFLRGMVCSFLLLYILCLHSPVSFKLIMSRTSPAQSTSTVVRDSFFFHYSFNELFSIILYCFVCTVYCLCTPFLTCGITVPLFCFFCFFATLFQALASVLLQTRAQTQTQSLPQQGAEIILIVMVPTIQ